MNDILLLSELMDTFLFGNHCHIFKKVIKCSQHFKNNNEYYQKINLKSGHKMDLYPAMNSLDDGLLIA